MICEYCGKNIESNNFFCTQCEKKLFAEDDIPTIATAAQTLLDPISDNILRFFVKHFEVRPSKEDVIRELEEDPNAVIYYFNELAHHGYIRQRGSLRGRPPIYELTQRGRKYLIEHPESKIDA